MDWLVVSGWENVGCVGAEEIGGYWIAGFMSKLMPLKAGG